MNFVSLVFPSINKVNKITSDGVTEFLLTDKPKPGVWVFKEQGIYAKPLRPAEPHEKTELFDSLSLPQVGVLPVARTSVFFTLPLNENQYRKYVKAKAPLPLFFTPKGLSVLDPVYARVYKHRRIMLLFEDQNDRYPQHQIDFLRQKLNEVKHHRDVGRIVDKLPLPKELRRAFMLVAEERVPPLERMVREALRIVQAKLLALTDEGSGQYRVTYEYKDRRTDVLIDDTLFVLDAHICLDGHEHDFDLSSIVLVKEKYYERELLED